MVLTKKNELHDDKKILNRTFLNSFSKMALLSIKFALFSACGKPFMQKNSKFYILWHHLKSCKKVQFHLL